MGLGAQLVERLLGAAEYEGSPPVWLVTEGAVVAVSAAVLTTGSGVGAVLVGLSRPGSTAVVLVVVAAVALHLLITGAGHLLVAGVTALGILLAPALSEVATEAVLVGAGRDRDVVVTAVAHEPTGNPAYYCSVRLRDGAPVGVRLWRGCGPAVEPGDVIGMVYDPEGRVGPRGIDGAAPLLRGLGETAALLLAFAALCLLAVVRSYRVSSAGSSHPRG
ncbi:hypothetical protein [Streptomyces sp. NPDC000961]|uniref:hypothetical protein n=1 Tax=Streptomyces sp. NPDC000961 TaxID=3364541 RepID=UPI003696BE4C